MKKLILLLLLIPSLLFAQDWQEARMNMGIIGGSVPAAGTNYTADANCQGAWYLNGNNGDEIDRSGNGNTLTDANTNCGTSANVPSGYLGASRIFTNMLSTRLYRSDGSLVGLDINGANQSITLVAWVYLDIDPVNTTWYVVIAKANTDNYQYLLSLLGVADNKFKIAFVLSSDGTWGNRTELFSTTTTYVKNTWYHIAATYDDEHMKIYINGAQDSSDMDYTGGIFNGTAEFCIGTVFPAAGFEYFKGQIDEVIVFNRTLNSTEILGIYNNGISGNKGGSD